MKKKRFSILSLVLTAVLAIVLTLGLTAGAAALLLGKTGLGVAEVMVLVHTRFVGEADVQQATDAAMDTLVAGLGDRWSYYVDEAGYRGLVENQNNAYVGIGVTIELRGDEGAYVIEVASGGGGEAAGIQVGETILAVDGVRLAGENRDRAAELVRGAVGTTVALLVRGTDGAERTVDAQRGEIRSHPVAYELLEDKTGLVTIRNFNRRCADEAIAAVDDLVARGAKRLVFDVRNNGGGYLDELTDLLDHLLPEGVIFRSGNRTGQTGSVSSDKSCVSLPMAVLVNGGTYSAAELFAAQLREMDWAVVAGEKTFGKGHSQQTFPLVSGGALNLSTATYFTGAGVSLIGTGVTLDEEVPLAEEMAQLLKDGALRPENDPQYRAARALLDETASPKPAE